MAILPYTILKITRIVSLTRTLSRWARGQTNACTNFILTNCLLIAALCLPLTVQAAPAPKNILILGDSLSAGYGLSISDAWVTLLQKELAGYKIVNASISGETTQGGKLRLANLLTQYKPAIVILALGANDGLRGYNTQEIELNLNQMIVQIKQAHAKTLVAGMKLPPNYGETYTRQFQDVYSRLASKHHVSLLPFLLDGVTQFQPDNLHPAASAQPIIMHNVQHALQSMLP
jgi:acyl-CoA thioesterase-1